MTETLKSGLSRRSKLLLTFLLTLTILGALLGVAGGLRHSGVITIGSTDSIVLTGVNTFNFAVIVLLALGASVGEDVEKQKKMEASKVEVPAETVA